MNWRLVALIFAFNLAFKGDDTDILERIPCHSQVTFCSRPSLNHDGSGNSGIIGSGWGFETRTPDPTDSDWEDSIPGFKA